MKQKLFLIALLGALTPLAAGYSEDSLAIRKARQKHERQYAGVPILADPDAWMFYNAFQRPVLDSVQVADIEEAKRKQRERYAGVPILADPVAWMFYNAFQRPVLDSVQVADIEEAKRKQRERYAGVPILADPDAWMFYNVLGKKGRMEAGM